MKKTLGIMGGIACGKSTVCNILADRYGAHIISVDKVAKDVRQRPEVDAQIVATLGDEIATDGKADISKLRVVVFESLVKMNQLTKILRPHIENDVISQIMDNRTDRVSVVENFFFEPGTITHSYLDEIWAVVCFKDVQKSRLMKRNGWNSEYCQKRIDAQPSLREMMNICDTFIVSGDDFRVTEEAVQKLWEDTVWDY